MNEATWIKTVDDGIARVPTRDEKLFANMWLTWSADSGYMMLPISAKMTVQLWCQVEYWFTKPVKRWADWKTDSENYPWRCAAERLPDALRVGSVLIENKKTKNLDIVPAADVPKDADIYWYDDPGLCQTVQEFMDKKGK
jgi:hypothetical protein